MLANDVDDWCLRAACIVEISEPISESGSEMEQGACGLSGHAGITIRGAGDHPFKKAENAAHSRHAVKRGDKVHFGCSWIREADFDTTRQQRTD
jgi:hypothetical protein